MQETRAWTVHAFEFPISLHSMGFLGVMRLHMKIYSLLALFLQQKRRLLYIVNEGYFIVFRFNV
ncbi:unnamed protein product [Brassica rapa]|uniref:Uncharacterized protein n=1 Tax=Brassica campestris TaxID=3711 RepID=A0A3P6B7Z4_BRACM|nr:unnamed protein product [Brassica rapa]VDC98435.1 unnamed protein product [Brassica rapa]